jgi:hypothetical protein
MTLFSQLPRIQPNVERCWTIVSWNEERREWKYPMHMTDDGEVVMKKWNSKRAALAARRTMPYSKRQLSKAVPIEITITVRDKS